jgi:RHS repeat-associated protein
MAYGREMVEVDLIQGSSTTEKISHIFTDHLGSTDVVQTTDVNNNILSTNNMSFGAWGNRRLATTWLPPVGATETQADHAADRYGFTHQEMLDNVALIHMNGRVYDPNLGRFLSVDPVFAFPTNTQSLNPYTYVLNNPLSMTDPTGYNTVCFDLTDNCISSGAPRDPKTGNLIKQNSSTNTENSGNNAGSNGNVNKKESVNDPQQKDPSVGTADEQSQDSNSKKPTNDPSSSNSKTGVQRATKQVTPTTNTVTDSTTINQRNQLSQTEQNKVTALVCAEACTSKKSGQEAVTSAIINRVNSGDNQYVAPGKDVNVSNVVESGQFQGIKLPTYTQAIKGELNNSPNFKSVQAAVADVLKNGVTTNATFIYHGISPPPSTTWMGRGVKSGNLLPATPAKIDNWYLYVPP